MFKIKSHFSCVQCPSCCDANNNDNKVIMNSDFWSEVNRLFGGVPPTVERTMHVACFAACVAILTVDQVFGPGVSTKYNVRILQDKGLT